MRLKIKKGGKTRDKSLRELIDETAELERVFANKYDARDQYMDLVEEVGELSQAMQITAGRKHTNDPAKRRTQEDVVDALCDVMFQVLRLSRHLGVDLPAEYEKVLERIKERSRRGEFEKR